MSQTETKIMFTINNAIDSKTPCKFNDKETLVDFINKEVSFWESNDFAREFQSELDRLKDVQRLKANADIIRHLENIKYFIPSESPEAKFIRNVCTMNINIGINFSLLRDLMIGKSPSSNTTKDDINAQTLFIIFTNKHLFLHSLTIRSYTTIKVLRHASLVRSSPNGF